MAVGHNNAQHGVHAADFDLGTVSSQIVRFAVVIPMKEFVPFAT